MVTIVQSERPASIVNPLYSESPKQGAEAVTNPLYDDNADESVYQ